MFSLSFVEGSKSAEGGPNPLADLDWWAPYPLADLNGGGPYLLVGGLNLGGPNQLGHEGNLHHTKKKQVLIFLEFFFLRNWFGNMMN